MSVKSLHTGKRLFCTDEIWKPARQAKQMTRVHHFQCDRCIKTLPAKGKPRVFSPGFMLLRDYSDLMNAITSAWSLADSALKLERTVVASPVPLLWN